VAIFRFVAAPHLAQIHLTSAGGSARLREDTIMTCASHAAPLETSGGSSLLHGLLTLWQRHRKTERTQHRLATLDTRAICDLGLPRDIVELPHPHDTADIWLGRIPG
jgi:hypothetical protein